MTNVSEVEKMAELMQQMEENSPRVAALQYCLKQVAEKVEEAEKRNAELEARCAALAAENAGMKDFVKTCFRAAADGASLDGADIQELGERLGLFGRETYQPALHGYICGHEAGEDTVYVMKKTPATDAFLAEVRAHGVEMFSGDEKKLSESHMQDGNLDTAIQIASSSRRASEFAAQLRKGV